MEPAWKKNKEPGGDAGAGGGAGQGQTRSSPHGGAALLSRVLDLEIPADVGYFHPEGVIRNGVSQQLFRRKRIRMPLSSWAPDEKVNIQSVAAEKGPGG